MQGLSLTGINGTAWFLVVWQDAVHEMVVRYILHYHGLDSDSL